MKPRERKAAADHIEVAERLPAARSAASVTALHQAGLQHFLAGQQLDAQVCCEKVLALDPAHADTLHLLGLIALHGGQYDHAVEWISRAIRQQPTADYLTSLGHALLKLGRGDDACAVFDKAVQLRPDDASLWRNLGDVLTDMGRIEEATLSFQHARNLNPRHWETAQKAALLLHQSGRIDEALAYFDLHEKMPSENALKLQMRALAMYIRGRFAEGFDDLKHAHLLDPANADICNRAGAFLRRLGREEEALIWFDRALALRPDYLAALQNKAFALSQLQRFAQAFAVYDAIKAIDPNDARAEFDAALVHLLTGNFAAGWAGREARSKIPGLQVSRFAFSQPRWSGKEPLAGKTILIHTDEGLGDAIQFVRYIPMVAARGARVILAVDDAIVPLLSDVSGVAQCVSRSSGALPPFDIYCPLSSLPLAFGTTFETIPASIAYLSAPAASRIKEWDARLGVRDRLRVGLVWSGNPKHNNDHNRSLPLSTLGPLLDLDASFVSLQKDIRSEDAAYLRQRPGIIDLTKDLTDFTETAALISCLDLVITVDTSVAHLAASMGRPTWILLPYTPDWRWLLDRDDSPWYPTARLFRQDEARDYASVVARVRDELSLKISRPATH